MITPTVGRIVWYRAKLLESSHPKESPEQAAIVVRVHGDRLVNLAVFGHSGHVVPMMWVPLVQDGDEAPIDRGYCHWMPYQLGQAAKTEAAEKSALELGAEARRLGTNSVLAATKVAQQ
jgi:hypothetical protein